MCGSPPGRLKGEKTKSISAHRGEEKHTQRHITLHGRLPLEMDYFSYFGKRDAHLPSSSGIPFWAISLYCEGFYMINSYIIQKPDLCKRLYLKTAQNTVQAKSLDTPSHSMRFLFIFMTIYIVNFHRRHQNYE